MAELFHDWAGTPISECGIANASERSNEDNNRFAEYHADLHPSGRTSHGIDVPELGSDLHLVTEEHSERSEPSVWHNILAKKGLLTAACDQSYAQRNTGRRRGRLSFIESSRSICNFALCDKSFARRSDLIRHQKDVHRLAESVFECNAERCLYRSRRKDKIKEHCHKMHMQTRGHEEFTVLSQGREEQAKSSEQENTTTVHVDDVNPLAGNHESTSDRHNGFEQIADVHVENQSFLASDGDRGREERHKSKRKRSPDPQSVACSRYPCPFSIGDPKKYSSHRTCYPHISPMVRHLLSHNFFICSKCLKIFDSPQGKASHDKLRSCSKICNNRACKRHVADLIPWDAVCKCMLTSDDVFAAIFRKIFPSLQLPEPWSSEVQSWIVEPTETTLSIPGVRTPSLEQACTSDFAGSTLRPTLLLDPYNPTPNWDLCGGILHSATPDCYSGLTATDPGSYLGYSNYSVPGSFQNVFPASQEADDIAEIKPGLTQRTAQESPEKPMQSTSDIEQQLEKQSMMLRLVWKHLVEIGHASVKKGGFLRRLAKLLTPELLKDGMGGNDAGFDSQIMECLNFDWDLSNLD